MSQHAYTEDQLVEQPAIALFAELGWQTVSATLDDGLPRAYTKELYESKCATLFEHMYESYRGDGASVFSESV